MDASFFTSLVMTYGYLGVFLASLIGSASILLPLPGFAFVFAAGAIFNPILVGLVAGLGSAIGELVGYGAGYGARYARHMKKDRVFKWANKWFNRGHGFWIILIFAATPLPDDIVGIICGYSRYSVKKFFIATLIGKIILAILLAYAGLYGIDFVRSLFA